MIKPAVNATLGTESTQRRSDMQLQLHELWDNGERWDSVFSGIRDKALQSNNSKFTCRLPAQEANDKDVCHCSLPDSG